MAIKTEQEIERDFYMMLVESDLGLALRGKVYRDEMRPADAKTEDLVVKYLAGVDDQIQEGVMLCHIYVPDLTQKGGRKVKNFERIASLQSLARQLFDKSVNPSEYRLSTDGSMKTIPVDGIDQHMIILRLRYRRISD